MKAGQLLLSLGVPTPEPLVCMEERHGRLLGASYLVCPFLEGCHSLFDLWPRLELFRKRLYMQSDSVSCWVLCTVQVSFMETATGAIFW